MKKWTSTSDSPGPLYAHSAEWTVGLLNQAGRNKYPYNSIIAIPPLRPFHLGNIIFQNTLTLLLSHTFPFYRHFIVIIYSCVNFNILTDNWYLIIIWWLVKNYLKKWHFWINSLQNIMFNWIELMMNYLIIMKS